MKSLCQNVSDDVGFILKKLCLYMEERSTINYNHESTDGDTVLM